MAKPATTSKKSSLKATIRDQSGAGKTKIGEVLSKEGQITSFQLEEALNYQKKHNGRLGNILLRLGYIDDETIPSVLSRTYNYATITISKITPEPEAVKLVPYEIAKKYMAFPFKLEGEQLSVVMAEPTDTGAVEALQKEIKKSLDVSVSTEKDIAEAYRKHYGISEEEYATYVAFKVEENEEEDRMSEVDDFGSLVSEALEDIELASPEIEDNSDQYSASDGPIIKLVNGILITAINEGVSDIHIEPFENSLQVRYRLDGSLYKSKNFPVSIKNALTSRIKILSGLNIAERRVPQDGRIKLKIGRTKAVDFRVSTLPTLFGESTVMRILDRGALNVDLTVMGFEKDTFSALSFF